MKKKYLFIGLTAVFICAAGALYFYVFPFIAHIQIHKEKRNYQTETALSFDNRFILKTSEMEDEAGFYVSFTIELNYADEILFQCSDRYRTQDLKSIRWGDGLYSVIVVSADVGTIKYDFIDDSWVKKWI